LVANVVEVIPSKGTATVTLDDNSGQVIYNYWPIDYAGNAISGKSLSRYLLYSLIYFLLLFLFLFILLLLYYYLFYFILIFIYLFSIVSTALGLTV
jgi:hypothetical protein